MVQSLESRGLGLGPRTVWRPVSLEPVDWLMLVGTFGSVAVVIGVTAAIGLGRGPHEQF